MSEPRDDMDRLKEEVARDLHLDDDIRRRGWENMTSREIGKIGGHMVKRMIRYAKRGMGEGGAARDKGPAPRP